MMTDQDRLDARLRLLSLLEARLRSDEDAWAALFPTDGEEAADLVVAAVELLTGTLVDDSTIAEALAEVGELRSAVIGGSA